MRTAAWMGALSLVFVLLAGGIKERAAAQVDLLDSNWTYCAPEGGYCSFSGQKEVRYGANGRYRDKVFSDGANCTDGVFGDPISSAVKKCWYRDWTSSPVPCDSARGSCARPQKLSKWDWQLSRPLDLSAAGTIKWYDLDWEDTNASTVQAIHAKGAKVACYISVGTWENYRGDRNVFPNFVKGKVYDEWPDERWLDVRRTDVLVPIMEARMNVCKQKGFDGVQFDNVDGFENNPLAKTGFPLQKKHYVKYVRWLANIAHGKGLSAAWENGAPLVPDLVAYTDWLILEECNQFDECGVATYFTDMDKFVGVVEYSDSITLTTFKTYCNDNTALGISSIFKKRSLNGTLLWSCQ